MKWFISNIHRIIKFNDLFVNIFIEVKRRAKAHCIGVGRKCSWKHFEPSEIVLKIEMKTTNHTQSMNSIPTPNFGNVWRRQTNGGDDELLRTEHRWGRKTGDAGIARKNSPSRRRHLIRKKNGISENFDPNPTNPSDIPPATANPGGNAGKSRRFRQRSAGSGARRPVLRIPSTEHRTSWTGKKKSKQKMGFSVQNSRFSLSKMYRSTFRSSLLFSLSFEFYI